MGNLINFLDSPQGKFQEIADNLNQLVPNIQQGENQFGLLGLVNKVESYFKAEMQKKFGVIVKFISDKSEGYLDHISLAGPNPVMYLKRKLSIDLIKAAKQGDVKSVINTLKNEIIANVKRVRSGELEESYTKREYLIFEVEAPVMSGDSLGTLASFKGALPVDKLSLVDTDNERDYVAKEYKKDHFILHPTKEYLQRTVINALYNQGLSEEELRNYIHIARNGIYRIIKEHLSESANYQYRKLGTRITISGIRYK